MIDQLYDWRAVLFALVIAAAIIDFRSLRIPNAIPLLVVAAAAVILIATGSPPEAYAAAAMSGLIGLGVGYALFAMRVMGGGDGKLFAAVAAWFGAGALLNLGFWISLCGVAVGLIAIIVKLAARRGKADRSLLKTPIPYGVAIAIGVIITAQASWSI